MIRHAIAAASLLLIWATCSSAEPARRISTTIVSAGIVEPMAYRSKVLELDRRVIVYLPVAYTAHPTAHFPVLYLRHGGGGNENDWIEMGKAPAILDRMFAAHKAVPMIVVFTRGQPPKSLGSPYDAPALAAAGRELMEDVIPLVEANYRASTGGANRALAGLSMGAGQSFAIGQAYSNDFSAMGIFSAGSFGIRGPASPNVPRTLPPGQPLPPKLRPFDPARDAAAALADPAGFNRRIPILYISVGDEDPRVSPTGAAIKLMRDRGLNIVSKVQHGKHDWPVWRTALADFVARLFGGPCASRSAPQRCTP